MFFIFIAKTSDCIGKGKINAKGVVKARDIPNKIRSLITVD